MKLPVSLCRSAVFAVCVPVLFNLGGCASPVTHQALVPTNSAVATQHAQSVAVTTGGGSETSAAGKSQVSDVELRQAVVAAINQSKVFARTVEGKEGDYQLNVNLVNLVQPSMGFSFTVEAEMGWALTKADTGAVIWRESIKSKHTTTTSEAFAGVTRLKMATEGAVRNNIEQGLKKLGELKL